MRTFAIVITMLLFVLSLDISSTDAATVTDKKECKAIKQKIRDIRSKMRAGYTRAQGERLEERLRKLRLDRARKCR